MLRTGRDAVTQIQFVKIRKMQLLAIVSASRRLGPVTGGGQSPVGGSSEGTKRRRGEGEGERPRSRLTGI